MKPYLISLFILLGLLSPSACAQTGPAASRLDRILDTLARYDQLRGSVLISQNGTTLYSRTIQPADTIASASSAPIYRIGSITKMLTATLVMQAVEKGQLSLTDKLSKFYPQVANASSISIAQLLSHSSGIQDYVEQASFAGYYKSSPPKAEMRKRISRFKPVFSPGTKTAYSNTNFLLLGWIMEDIHHTSFQELIQKNIAQPLQLESLRAADAIVYEGRVLPSYKWLRGSWVLHEKWGAVAGAAGNIVSSPGDLVTFINALTDGRGRLLADSTARSMCVARGTIEGDMGVGFGMLSIDYEGRTAWGHLGTIEGFNSAVMTFPDDHTTFCILLNGERFPLNDVFNAVLDSWYGAEVQMPSFRSLPAIKLDSSALVRFVGTYAHPSIKRIKMRIAASNGGLVGYVARQEPTPFEATDSTHFRNLESDTQIHFVPDSTGRLLMKYKQGDLSLELPRQ